MYFVAYLLLITFNVQKRVFSQEERQEKKLKHTKRDYFNIIFAPESFLYY
jgi:hypothetical protein